MLKQRTIKSILIISLTLFFSQSAYAINGWASWYYSIHGEGTPESRLVRGNPETSKITYITQASLTPIDGYGKCANSQGKSDNAQAPIFTTMQLQSTQEIEDDNGTVKGKGKKNIKATSDFTNSKLATLVDCDRNNSKFDSNGSWFAVWGVVTRYVIDVEILKCDLEESLCKDSEDDWILENFEVIENDIFECAFDQGYIVPFMENGIRPPEGTEYYCIKQ